MTTSQHFKQSGTQRIYMESTGLMEKLITQIFQTNFVKIVLLKPNTKCKILSNYLCRDVENLDDFGCPKASKLISNEDTMWECNNVPYRHKKTLHCAEKKASACGTRILNFFCQNLLFVKFFLYFDCNASY